MNLNPTVAWLVVACDLPFLDHKTLNQLVANRDTKTIATCYESASDHLPEPLCTVWEPHAQTILQNYLAKGVRCPRKVLINIQPKMLQLPKKDALQNVNHKEEYSKVISNLNPNTTPS